MAPEAVATAIMMPIAGRLLDKIGPRPLAIPLTAWSFAYRPRADRPDTSDTTIAMVLALRGATQGMMMLPLMTVAMDRIPKPACMSRATVLATVIRQIAGAFGAASAASMLLGAAAAPPGNAGADRHAGRSGRRERRVHAHRPVEQGVSLSNASLMALGQLNDRTKVAASVRAYDDCFLIFAIITLLVLIPVLWVPRRRQQH